MTTAIHRAVATRLGQELTDREIQVLRGAANGLPNAEIGRQLFLAENTVKTHMQRASRKLGAASRAHAVALALQQGVLTLRDIQPTLGPLTAPQAPQAALRRVRFLLGDWRCSGGPPAAHLIANWWDHKLTQLATAIDPQEPTP